MCMCSHMCHICVTTYVSLLVMWDNHLTVRARDVQVKNQLYHLRGRVFVRCTLSTATGILVGGCWAWRVILACRCTIDVTSAVVQPFARK